jgi:hypothetical protein
VSEEAGPTGLLPPAEVDPEVLAAIVAAVDQVWPRPVLVAAEEERPSTWRFSGRWWATPISMRRQRPVARR